VGRVEYYGPNTDIEKSSFRNRTLGSLTSRRSLSHQEEPNGYN